MPLLKAKLKSEMDKSAQDRTNTLKGEAKTRTRLLALRAVGGDLDSLDLDNLDALGRISGKLKNTYLESLSADKITSATILARTLTLAGTEASNNKTSLVMIGDALIRVNDGFADRLRISNSGLELSTSSEAADPAAIPGRGISMLGTSAIRIWPYDNSVRRGWQMRADGVAGGKNGRLTFIATRNPASAPGTDNEYANLIVSSETLPFINFTSRSGVSIRNSLSVIGPMRSSSGIESDAGVFSGGNMLAGGRIESALSLTSRGGLTVFGGSTLEGLDATNIRASGGYNNTGAAATFGGALRVAGRYEDAGATAVFGGSVQAIGNLRVGGQYENTGDTALFGGSVSVAGNLLNPGRGRINAAEYGAITNVAAGATVTLPYGGGLGPLWVDVRWRTSSTDSWRPSTGSLSTTGVNVNLWNSNGVSASNNTGASRQVQAIFWA